MVSLGVGGCPPADGGGTAMTSTEILSSVVDKARAKVAAVEAKGASYIPQILDAHKQVVAAERSGHQRSLDAAIAAGELLIAAQEAIKGKFKWGEWRSEYLSEIPQTTASLYMRLAKNKDKLKQPDLTTEDGRRISNGVATLSAKGELSIRKAAALLTTRSRTTKATTGSRKSGDDEREITKRCIKEVLAADELVAIALEVRDADYIKEIVIAGQAVLQKAPAQTAAATSGNLRRY
jgi:hypothetical protein